MCDAITERNRRERFFPCIAAVALASASLLQAAELNVEVAGLKNAKRKVCVAVYRRAEDVFKQPERAQEADAQSGKVKILPPAAGVR